MSVLAARSGGWITMNTSMPDGVPKASGPRNVSATAMPKKKEKSEPVCGTCGEPFDRRGAAKAAREGRAFVHACGRVLVRGNLSALPTHDHVYDPKPKSGGSGSSPSTGV